MKIFLSILLVIILGISLSFGLDEYAMKLQDEAFDRAMIAFGLAKGLNAIISLIQGTEISVTPVGVGLNFSVGEVLDPFNDMVERFSWVMLLSTVSLGIQKLLLLLSSKIFLQVVLGISVALTLLLVWVKKAQNYNLLEFSLKIFLVLVLLRFSALFFVYTSELLYSSLLAVEYENSKEIVLQTQTKLEDLNTQSREIVTSKKELSFLENIRSSSSGLVESLNLSKKLQSLETDIDEASRNIINLITIFLVQSLIMPLLFLWILVLSIKGIFRVDFNSEKLLYNKLNL